MGKGYFLSVVGWRSAAGHWSLKWNGVCEREEADTFMENIKRDVERALKPTWLPKERRNEYLLTMREFVASQLAKKEERRD